MGWSRALRLSQTCLGAAALTVPAGGVPQVAGLVGRVAARVGRRACERLLVRRLVSTGASTGIAKFKWILGSSHLSVLQQAIGARDTTFF